MKGTDVSNDMCRNLGFLALAEREKAREKARNNVKGMMSY